MTGNKRKFIMLGTLALVLATALLLIYQTVQSGRPGSKPSKPRPAKVAKSKKSQSNVGIHENIPGRWFPAPTSSAKQALTEKQKAQVEKLKSVGYLSGYSEGPEQVSVLQYDKTRAYPGYNFYTSGHDSEAILMDMEGRELHKWDCDVQKLWPGVKVEGYSNNDEFFRRAYLLDNGDILAIFEGIGLVKLDRDSNVLWKKENQAHHDLFIDKDGTIYALTREVKLDPAYHKKKMIMDDFISILSPDGKEIRRFSLLKSLENSKYKPFLNHLKSSGDLLHTNTIEKLDGTWAHRCPAFAKGNLLVSFLFLSLIGVVDPEQETFVWADAGMWYRQHDPTLLKNGHMLIFDNRGMGKRSRVFEFDPLTQEIFWKFEGTPDRPFYSRNCGTSTRLPNGNTLITESNAGHVFEVTKDQKIVWEFFNPYRAGEKDELIATIFDLNRVDAKKVDKWLNNKKDK